MSVIDRISRGSTQLLPPEAGDQAEARFEPDNQWLRKADAEQQKSAMWRWFATRYESPITAVPHDANEFLYMGRGPFLADEVLHARFEPYVSPAVIDALVIAIQTEAGNEWAAKPVDRFGG